MRKIYLFLFTTLSLYSTLVKGQLPSSCFEIQSILVDACGSPEGVNEMVRFQVGSTPLNTSTLTTIWGQNPVSGATSNPWRGICSNAGTASRVNYLNSTIAKCGFIKEPIGGVLPPNAKVILVTSDTFDVYSNPFTNLTDTVYMIFQCKGNTGGHFLNFSPTPNTIKRLIMNFGSGCIDTVQYDAHLLVNQSGVAANTPASTRDGASVEFTYNGSPHYFNNGCQAAIPISTIFAGNDSSVCPAVTLLSLKGNASGVKNTTWVSLGSGTFSQKDSLNTDYTLSATDVFPITFYLKGYLGCGDSIQDTIIYNKLVNTISAGPDDSICTGSSIIVFASGGSNYFWTPNTGVSNQSSPTPTLSPTVTTEYYLTGNYGPGCVGYDTIKLTVFPLDTIILTKDTTICFGQAVQLQVSNVPSVVFTADPTLSCTACLNPVATPTSTLTYTATSNGYCPDTKSVTVTVKTVTTTSQTINDCDSTTFLGNKYYNNATVLDTTKSYLGCDSIIRTTQINITNTTTSTQPHCIYNGDSILIAGVYQKTQGIYTELVPNGTCFDKVYHLLQVVTKQTNTQTLSDCNSVVYKTKTYTSSTVVRDTVKSVFGCDSVYNIANITIYNNSVATNRSICINNGQSYFVGNANQTTSGIYRDTFALSTGCDSISVTDLNVITPSNNNNAVQACKQYTYKGNTYFTSTVVKDTVKSLLGCDSVYNNFAIAINNQVVTAQISDCILKGQVYVLGSKQCNKTGVFRDTTALASGCDSITILNLNVIDTLTINDTVKSCNPYVYNGNTYNSTTTVHEVTLSVQGCDSVYHNTNIIISPFKYYHTGDVCINQGQTYFAGGANQSTSGTYTDKLTTAFGCDSFITTNLNVITVKFDTIRIDSCNQVTYNGIVYNQNTTLNNSISSVQGCDSVEQTVILGIRALTVNITESNGTLPVNYGETVQLNANTSSTVKSYVWTPTQFVVGSSTGNSIVVKPEANTTYQVAVKDSFCTAFSSIVVDVVEPETKYAMPTAFTPNGDGVNDLYRPILMPNLVTKEFRIYNRWGEKVFESTAIEPGWDGTFRDSKQPVGVYVYYITVQNTVTNKTVYHSGNITLIR